MSDQDKDKLRDSTYDGIQEYDNRLPNWWLGIFILSLIGGFGYWFRYYTFPSGVSQQDEYARNLEQYEALQAKQPDMMIDDETLRSLEGDLVAMADGKAIFNGYCAVCHGNMGEGGIGPNLTDAHWIHGWEPTTIRSIVVNGVADKGMTPWKGVLSDKQINHVTAYVLSLEGTDPPNPKAPQGDIVRP